MELICRAEPRPARALPAQDGYLMSQGDEFELQGEAITKPERERGTEGGQKREHAGDGMAVAPKILCFLGVLEFCAGRGRTKECHQQAGRTERKDTVISDSVA